MINTLFQNPIAFVISAVSIIIAITVHEFAHAKMADHLGDPTPRLQGRISLNPLKHLDLYGTVFLLIFGFGWGKPVQFDPFNLKNMRKDAAIISLAGPASNFILATICSLLIRLFIFIGSDPTIVISSFLLEPFIVMNLVLGIFNLIPIHPLDGFKIVGGFLSDHQAREWYQLERYGIFFLLLLIYPFNGQSMLHMLLDPVLGFLYTIFIPSPVMSFM